MKNVGKLFAGLFLTIALAFGVSGFAQAPKAEATNYKESPSFSLPDNWREQLKTKTLGDIMFEESVGKKLREYTGSDYAATSFRPAAIPESDLWDKAYGKIGQYGTIAGPVSSVYQAKNSPGQPTFINIGNPYPNKNRAQIVIWPEQRGACADLLNDIGQGKAWVSFTGYISLYQGVPEINLSDGYTEWTWWVQK